MSKIIPLSPSKYNSPFLICGRVIAINKSHQPIKIKDDATSETFEIRRINPFLGKVEVGSEVVCIATAQGLIAILQSIEVDDNAPQISLDASGFRVQHAQSQLEMNAKALKLSGEELQLHSENITNLRAASVLVNCSEETIQTHRTAAKQKKSATIMKPSKGI